MKDKSEAILSLQLMQMAILGVIVGLLISKGF